MIDKVDNNSFHNRRFTQSIKDIMRIVGKDDQCRNKKAKKRGRLSSKVRERAPRKQYYEAILFSRIQELKCRI